jgi:hypothetical protein
MPVDRLQIRVGGSVEQPTQLAFRSVQEQLDRLVEQINGLFDAVGGGLVLAGSSYTSTSSDAGKTILLNSLTGSAVVLPAAIGTGDIYRCAVSVVATSGSHTVQVPTDTDIMQGLVFTVSDDTNAVLGWRTANDTHTITLNRTTKGSVEAGEMITFLDAEEGLWLVNGFTASTGTEATPFSGPI